MGWDRASAVLSDLLKDLEIAAVPPGFRSSFRDWACRLLRNMLHAVLHGKLDESLLEPDRLEDALTSTVFGGQYDLTPTGSCPSRIRCQAATGSWTKSRQWEI